MSVALFRLESFSAPAPEPVFTRTEMDEARAEARAAALAEAGDAERDALIEALNGLARRLSDETRRRDALRAEAVEALVPILRQIVLVLGPAGASARIETALTDELRRIAAGTQPPGAAIACAPRLRPLLDRCLKAAGITGIAVSDSPNDGITVGLTGGRIEFDPDRVTRDLLAILADIQKDETPWTP